MLYHRPNFVTNITANAAIIDEQSKRVAAIFDESGKILECKSVKKPDIRKSAELLEIFRKSGGQIDEEIAIIRRTVEQIDFANFCENTVKADSEIDETTEMVKQLK
jgi:hypothetical protein